MKETSTVVIIGGGVIGCAIAYYLRKSGIDATIVERGEFGAEASSAAAGLLAPLGSHSGPGPLAQVLLASWSRFPPRVPELEQITRNTHADARTGALRIVRNPRNIANLRKRMQAWQPLGLEMLWLTGDEARQREPLLADDISAAIYAPAEGQISAPHVANAFAQAAHSLGAILLSNTEVISLQHHRQRITGITTSQGQALSCNHLVIANGAWAAQCKQWLGLRVPVSPQRGQMLALRQPSSPLRYILFGEAVYVVPKADNTILVGATKEDVGFEKQTTAGGIAWLLNTALRLVPSLAESAIERIWSGLRPKTPDNAPILGTVPGWENISLAVGHGSVGIMLSAITGESIASLVTTGEVPALLHPFSLERFLSLNEPLRYVL